MRAPPIWVFPVALMLVAGALSPWLPEYIRFRADESGSWQRYVHHALEERGQVLAPDSRDLRHLAVVSVGSSVLQNAVLYNEELESCARQEAKRPLNYVEITRFERDWDPLPVIEGVCASHPDVLLLEDNLLFLREPPESRESLGVNGYLKTLRYRVLGTLHDLDRASTQLGPMRLNGPPDRFRSPAPRSRPVLDAYLNDRAHKFFPEEAIRYVKPLAEAHRSGVTIVLLDLSMTAPSARFSNAQISAIEKLHALLVRDAGAIVWRCPIEFGEGDFRDEVHLMRAGQERFSRWLVEKLDELPIR